MFMVPKLTSCDVFGMLLKYVLSTEGGFVGGVADATRTLRTLRISWMKNMIRKSLNVFRIRQPGAIRRTILGCVTGVLWMSDPTDGISLKVKRLASEFFSGDGQISGSVLMVLAVSVLFSSLVLWPRLLLS